MGLLLGGEHNPELQYSMPVIIPKTLSPSPPVRPSPDTLASFRKGKCGQAAGYVRRTCHTRGRRLR